MERLQAEGVRGADLVFACIGPALEIYSQYSKVVDAEDREIPLGGDAEATDPYHRGYLAYVWEAVGRAALQQVLGQDEGTGSLEEDARLVALFLWTLQSTNGLNGGGEHEEAPEEDDLDEEDGDAPGRKPKGYTLIFDVARRFAQALGIHLDDWEGRIIETKKGVVRLLPVGERAKQLFGEDGAQSAADRIENFDHLYRPVATTWRLYDASVVGVRALIAYATGRSDPAVVDQPKWVEIRKRIEEIA